MAAGRRSGGITQEIGEALDRLVLGTDAGRAHGEDLDTQQAGRRLVAGQQLSGKTGTGPGAGGRLGLTFAAAHYRLEQTPKQLPKLANMHSRLSLNWR